MAQRTISTRILMQGEKEYRNQMKMLNAEMKTLKSELKAVDSDMKTNGKTTESLAQKEKTLTDAINKQNQMLNAEKQALDNAKAAQNDFANKAEEARQKLNRLQQETDESTKETDEYKQALAQAQAEVNKWEAAEQRAALAVEKHQQNINKGEADLNKYKGQLQQTGEESKSFGAGLTEQFKSMAAGALTVSGAIAAVKKLAQAMVECVESAMKWESAFAGVKKTVDASSEEYKVMADQIRNMATELPFAADEIARVAESAGQLGVSKDEVIAFSKTMLELGVSTNLSADEAATALARFANITGLSLSEVDALGSVIVDLGNNFATTEKEIVDMASNVAAAGAQVGLTEPEILAVATALSSLGLEAASGGSSFSRLLVDMQLAVETSSERLAEFAQIAGMTSTEFRNLWRDDTAAAVEKFFNGISTGGTSAIKVLQDLGIKNIRQRDTMLRVANAGDLLGRAIETANTAFDENVALTIEATKRNSTLESQLQVTKNKMEETRIEVGENLTPATIALNNAWAEMLPLLPSLIPNYQMLTNIGNAHAEAQIKAAEATEEQIKASGRLRGEQAKAAREAGETSKQMQLAVDGLAARMDVLNEAYEDAFDAAYEGISKTVDGFGELDGAANTTTEKIIKNLKSQTTFMQDYAENIRTAAKWGIDEGLLKTLSDGSVESAKLVASIVKSGQDGVADLNKAWQDTRMMEIEFAHTMAGIQTDIDVKNDEIVRDLGDMVRRMNSQFDSFSTQKALQEVAKLQREIGAFDFSKLEGIGGFGRSHAAGLNYVPYDNYAANLHKGEMVLTALEARAYRAERSLETIQNNTAITFGDINVNLSSGSEASAKAAGKTIMQELQTQLRQRGVRF